MEITQNMFYILQLTNIARRMANTFHILSTIFLKEFIKINVNTDTLIKQCKTC